MTAVAGSDPTNTGAPDGAVPCPRCGELLATDQDWCLVCGDPARTVIAPTPRWRRPLLAIAALAIVALGVLTAAFISLTDDDPPPPVTITNTITTQPGDVLPPGVTPGDGATTAAPPAGTTTTTPTTTPTTTSGATPTTTSGTTPTTTRTPTTDDGAK